MAIDDRFESFAEALAGFYRSWLVYLGLELGLFARLHDAGEAGLAPAELAAATGCAGIPVEGWVRAAHAAELVEDDGARVRLDPEVASILLGRDRPEYLGGQFVLTVVASMDYERMAEFFRTGRPIAGRPPRFHRAIEALTHQDTAVFFQEGLAALPELAADLAAGASVLDVACGGGRWLVSIARRFPETRLLGVEVEPDSVERAMRHVTESGLANRIRIEALDITAQAYRDEFDLAYFQDALHELPEPVAALRSAWAAVRPGGRVVVLDWCLPAGDEAARTLQGELLWGINLDELFQGTRLYTHEGFLGLFAAAGIPAPAAIDLPSGATIFLAQREPAA